ncbi:hypothetical protein BsWGS_17211 [Bradybaena similaris]
MALVVTPGGNFLRVVTPDHVYRRPCPGRVKLAGVKHQIYHPSLPTFRAMDRDEMLHKLANDHCRTTTSCTRGEFEEATMNPLKPAALRLHCIDITETGRHVQRMYQSMEDIQNNVQRWSQYRDKVPCMARQRRPALVPQDLRCEGFPRFDGVAVKYFKSGIRNREVQIC